MSNKQRCKYGNRSISSWETDNEYFNEFIEGRTSLISCNESSVYATANFTIIYQKQLPKYRPVPRDFILFWQSRDNEILY